MKRDFHFDETKAREYIKLAGLPADTIVFATAVWVPGRRAGFYYRLTDLQQVLISRNKKPPDVMPLLSRWQRRRYKQRG